VSRGLIGGAAFLTLLVFVYGLRVNAVILRASFPDEVTYYLPPPEYAPALALGYREAAADLIWVATIQHTAERRILSGRRFPFLERYLDTVIALNPYNLKLYLWADGTITYGRGRLTNELWWLSIRYLRRGHQAFPGNWEILFKLGCAFTELEAASDAQRSAYRRTAADYIWKAHLVGGGPHWLGSLAARYWSDEGQWLLAYHKTLEEYEATEDPAVRAVMESRLVDLMSRSTSGTALVDLIAGLGLPALGSPGMQPLFLLGDRLQRLRISSLTGAQIDEVSGGKARFDQAHRRCLPYASSSLFALLGECDRLKDPGLPREPWDASPTADATGVDRADE
jgi:hypothetical protein